MKGVMNMDALAQEVLISSAEVTSARELEEKARALLREAEALRKREREEKILEIVEIMKAWDITSDEIAKIATKRKTRFRAKGEPRFRDPVTGKAWAGMGRQPEWLKAALQSGRSIDEFRIAD